MTRTSAVLRSVAHTALTCPLPGMLVQVCYDAGGEHWWAGVLPDGHGARGLAAGAARLAVTGPTRFQDPEDRVDIRPWGELHRVTGELASGPVVGVLDQPGTRGWLRNMTAYTRARRRVRLQVPGRPELWLRARGASRSEVRTGEGRRVATGNGREIRLETSAPADEQVLAVLLLTAVSREAILPFGDF